MVLNNLQVESSQSKSKGTPSSRKRLHKAGGYLSPMEAISLGWLNRWLGSGLGALKFLLLTSLVICVIEFIDSDNKLISATKKSESLLYYPMETFAGIFFPAAKNITQQYILDNKDATRRTQ